MGLAVWVNTSSLTFFGACVYMCVCVSFYKCRCTCVCECTIMYMWRSDVAFWNLLLLLFTETSLKVGPRVYWYAVVWIGSLLQGSPSRKSQSSQFIDGQVSCSVRVGISTNVCRMVLLGWAVLILFLPFGTYRTCNLKEELGPWQGLSSVIFKKIWDNERTLSLWWPSRVLCQVLPGEHVSSSVFWFQCALTWSEREREGG